MIPKPIPANKAAINKAVGSETPATSELEDQENQLNRYEPTACPAASEAFAEPRWSPLSRPPHHSKYNPVERCWSSLEGKFSGVLLSCVSMALWCAQRMTWQGKHPEIAQLPGEYPSGVKLSAKEMAPWEARLNRSPKLPKYDIASRPQIAATAEQENCKVWFFASNPRSVIPAQAGIQLVWDAFWIPAFAGMTGRSDFAVLLNGGTGVSAARLRDFLKLQN